MAYQRPIPEKQQRGKAGGALNALVEAEKLMQIALLLPSAAFIGWLLGAWIGEKLHQPWLETAGIVFGGVSGLVYVVRMALAAGRASEAEDAAENEAEDADKRTTRKHSHE